MDELLTIRSLTQTFGTRQPVYAVDDVSFSLPEEPGFLNLVGESGSGKTTIARIVLGLLRPTRGTVLYRNRDIFEPNSRWQQQFRREVQAVFQDPYSVFNPVYKIGRVLHKPIQKFHLAGSKAETKDMVEASLGAVDLRSEDVLGKYPHQLSGGQRQRLMLARLHLIRPNLIIADEAVSMVDAAGRVTFLNILLDFRTEYNISTLYITHDLSTAQYLGGDMIVLYKGRIVEQGDTQLVTTKPLHPYAQLLIESIPVPDPEKRWKKPLSSTVAKDVVGQTMGRNRCLFAERCPHVTDVCWNVRPMLRRPADASSKDTQVVACHLYS
jgi:oligopeptide/dipeptide ABC transporter ATP-binding protein